MTIHPGHDPRQGWDMVGAYPLPEMSCLGYGAYLLPQRPEDDSDWCQVSYNFVMTHLGRDIQFVLLYNKTPSGCSTPHKGNKATKEEKPVPRQAGTRGCWLLG